MPLFSIIIPVYNRASTISLTIYSIINQLFKDFEIIVIDDGSTDQLQLALTEFINCGFLTYYHQSNAGVSAARNKGAIHSKGDYLIFLDSDDSVTLNWLSDFSHKISFENPDIIYCGINRVKENKVIEYTDPTDPYRDGNNFGNVIPGSFCIRKIFFEKIGWYDYNLAYGENTELSFRIKSANPSTAFINAPNLLYLLQDNSHGKNAKNKLHGLIYTMNKHVQLFKDNKDMKIRFLSIAGVAAIQSDNQELARKLFFDAWKLTPFRINILLRLIFSFSPMVSQKIWAIK